MIDEFGNAPKKGGQIAKAVLIPGIAFAAWYFFSFLVGNAAAFLFAAYEANKHPGADEETLKNLIYTVYDKNISLLYIIGAALFILTFYLIYRRTHFTRSININTRKIGGPLGLMAFAMGMFVGSMSNAAISLLSSHLPQKWIEENQESVDAFHGGSVFLAYFATVVAAPIVEELLFRGFLYHGLKKIFHTFLDRSTAAARIVTIVLSAGITSLLFGLYHGNALQAIYAGLLSLVMIWIYETTKSMLSNILFHAAFNFAGVMYAMLFLYFGDIGCAVISAAAAVALAVGIVKACNRRDQIDTYGV